MKTHGLGTIFLYLALLILGATSLVASITNAQSSEEGIHADASPAPVVETSDIPADIADTQLASSTDQSPASTITPEAVDAAEILIVPISATSSPPIGATSAVDISPSLRTAASSTSETASTTEAVSTSTAKVAPATFSWDRSRNKAVRKPRPILATLRTNADLSKKAPSASAALKAKVSFLRSSGKISKSDANALNDQLEAAVIPATRSAAKSLAAKSAGSTGLMANKVSLLMMVTRMSPQPLRSATVASSTRQIASLKKTKTASSDLIHKIIKASSYKELTALQKEFLSESHEE